LRRLEDEVMDTIPDSSLKAALTTTT